MDGSCVKDGSRRREMEPGAIIFEKHFFFGCGCVQIIATFLICELVVRREVWNQFSRSCSSDGGDEHVGDGAGTLIDLYAGQPRFLHCKV